MSILKRYKCIKRLELDKLMKKKKIKVNQKKHKHFYRFINNNYNQKLKLLEISIGLYNIEESKKKFKYIWKDYINTKDDDTIYFHELFELNKDWYPFFKENCYPDGTRRADERRKGVDRQYVEDIEIIINKTDISLMDAIIFYSNALIIRKAKIEFNKRKS